MYDSHYTENAWRMRQSVLRPQPSPFFAYAALTAFAALLAYGLALSV
jgi:hypothetical protein